MLAATVLFPSPYGDFVFQRISGRASTIIREYGVSVPLRGFCFSTGLSIQRKGAFMTGFPSPYGDFVFQRAKGEVCYEKRRGCFRPLTGILFFNLLLMKYQHGLMMIVSVPLRGFCFSTPAASRVESHARTVCFRPLTGILFFNWKITGYYADNALKSFRPLTGILFFNRERKEMKNRFNAQFPSPYGDFVFQPAVLRAKAASWRGVSVPLRGFCFSTFMVYSYKHEIPKKFPSPYGDFVFQLEGIPFMVSKKGMSFRPLTGILFFNVRQARMVKPTSDPVSVPLRGFCFSTPPKAPIETSYEVSVPLRGFCFSTDRATTDYQQSQNVSVPLRGFCFSTG